MIPDVKREMLATTSVMWLQPYVSGLQPHALVTQVIIGIKLLALAVVGLQTAWAKLLTLTLPLTLTLTLPLILS